MDTIPIMFKCFTQTSILKWKGSCSKSLCMDKHLWFLPSIFVALFVCLLYLSTFLAYWLRFRPSPIPTLLPSCLLSLVSLIIYLYTYLLLSSPSHHGSLICIFHIPSFLPPIIPKFSTHSLVYLCHIDHSIFWHCLGHHPWPYDLLMWSHSS